MAGIFDNFNTPIPNLVSGGNLIGSTLSLSDAYNKLFGTGKGGVLDFLNDQQEQIRKRNTQDMTQRMKSLTPDQLRQIEDAGLNPYTDLPAMYGANNGVIVDTEKAFAGADTAGANLVAANNNTLNTMYNQLTPLEKADLLTKEGDYTQNMLELFKEKGNRPGLRFYDDKAFRMNADTAYKKGYDTLLDEMEKANATNTDYKNSDSYVVPRNVSPELEKQLRLDTATQKRNRAVTEAAYAIDSYMKAHPNVDWLTAAETLGINKDLLSEIDLSKLNNPYDSTYLKGYQDLHLVDSNINAAKSTNNSTVAKNEADIADSFKRRIDTEAGIDKAKRNETAKKLAQTDLVDALKDGIKSDTFTKIDQIKKAAIASGDMSNEEFNKLLLENTTYSDEIAKYTEDMLYENKQTFAKAFERDKATGKYNLENMNTAITQIASNISQTLEASGVPKALIPTMVQHVISRLTNDMNVGKLSNFNDSQKNYIDAMAGLEAEAGTGTQITKEFYRSLKSNETDIPDPFTSISGVDKVMGDRISKEDLKSAVGAQWNTQFGPEAWKNLGPAGQNYIMYCLLDSVRKENRDAWKESQKEFTDRVVSILKNNVKQQGNNLRAPAEAISKVYQARHDLSINSVAPTKADSK